MESMAAQHHTSKDITQLLVKYQLDNPDCPLMKGRDSGKGSSVDGKRSRGGGEKYEKPHAKHGDRMFLRFQKELSNCPQQIVR
jgi:hypothetical protein